MMIKALIAMTILVGLLGNSFCLVTAQDSVAGRDVTNQRIKLKQGDIELELSTPGDSENHRGTRFDHSGIFQAIRFRGISLCERWRTGNLNPDANDDVCGPCEEFGHELPLGYVPGKPQSRFIKIGVGILVQPDETKYGFFNKYEYAQRGEWKVEHHDNSVHYEQELIDRDRDEPIGYRYIKIIRIKSDGWFIEHELFNLGKSDLVTDHYNHNFFLVDSRPVGQDYELEIPYTALPTQTNESFGSLVHLVKSESPNKTVLQFTEDVGVRSYFARLAGHDATVEANRWILRNKASGIAIHCAVNAPLYKFNFWGVSRTICPEPYVNLNIPPGKSTSWVNEYTIKKED